MIAVRDSDNIVVLTGAIIQLFDDYALVGGLKYYGITLTTHTLYAPDPPDHRSRYTYDGSVFALTPNGLDTRKAMMSARYEKDANAKKATDYEILEIFKGMLLLLEDLGFVSIQGNIPDAAMKGRFNAVMGKFNSIKGIDTALDSKLNGINAATTDAELDAIEADD